MVYLTKQRHEGEHPDSGATYTRWVAVQKCGDAPYEVTLRFANCSLRCGACFASAYSWSDKFKQNKRVHPAPPVATLLEEIRTLPPTTANRPYNWLRVLGGEPLLNDEYVAYVMDFVIGAASLAGARFRHGVIIQTNGIHIGGGHTEVLRAKLEELHRLCPQTVVAIETSIKGTNHDEFQLLTRSDSALYTRNIQSYYNLQNLSMPNLRPVVIAGFGLNEAYLLREGNCDHRITILADDRKPVYHPTHWDTFFGKLYADFTGRYSSELDQEFRRMPMYGVKDQFQYAWAKRALGQIREIYPDHRYDSTYAAGNEQAIEQFFRDIRGKFFLKSNQWYYGLLTRPLVEVP